MPWGRDVGEDEKRGNYYLTHMGSIYNMSRLKQTKTTEEIPGWQWDDGPIFLGDDARFNAVNYGKTVQRLEDFVDLATLQHAHEHNLREIERLKKIKREKELHDVQETEVRQKDD